MTQQGHLQKKPEAVVNGHWLQKENKLARSSVNGHWLQRKRN